jgi:hypothetical protein
MMPPQPTERDDDPPASAPTIVHPIRVKTQRELVRESLIRCPEVASEGRRG